MKYLIPNKNDAGFNFNVIWLDFDRSTLHPTEIHQFLFFQTFIRDHEVDIARYNHRAELITSLQGSKVTEKEQLI